MGKQIIVTFVASALLITAISAQFEVENVEEVKISPENVLLSNDSANGYHQAPSEAVMKRAAQQILHAENYESYTSCAKYFAKYHDSASTVKSHNMFEITLNSETGRAFWLKRIGTGESDSDFVIFQETAFDIVPA